MLLLELKKKSGLSLQRVFILPFPSLRLDRSARKRTITDGSGGELRAPEYEELVLKIREAGARAKGRLLFDGHSGPSFSTFSLDTPVHPFQLFNGHFRVHVIDGHTVFIPFNFLIGRYP